jgi:hypothetical protein
VDTHPHAADRLEDILEADEVGSAWSSTTSDGSARHPKASDATDAYTSTCAVSVLRFASVGDVRMVSGPRDGDTPGSDATRVIRSNTPESRRDSGTCSAD